MQVAITCRHGSIRDELRQQFTEKSEKLLHYFERVTAIEVTIDFQNDHLVKVEMLVDAEHKHNFVAHDSGEEVVATFNRTLSKMEQQVRRYKDKLQDHSRDVPTSEIAPDPVELRDDDSSETESA